MTEPEWANVLCKTRLSSDFYYSAPKAVDPNKIRRCRSRAFRNVQKLGISVDEQKMMNNVAMDIVVDSFQSPRPSKVVSEKELSL
jgi:Fe-S cluster assembly protein SufB